jgi:hypothetical protein
MLPRVTRAPEASPGTAARALRALAHPLRWKLIDLLEAEGSATATRCADALGESVPSCSYHLGILGKYGYAEMVPGQPGREKPWRPASRGQDLSPAGLDGEGALAAAAATEVFLDHELARLKTRLRRHGFEPAQWQEASGVAGETTWMTAAELRTVWRQIQKTMLRHADRGDDPALRPRTARQVRLFAAATVAPPAPAAPAPSAPPASTDQRGA